MPELVDEFEQNGFTWRLKVDSKGRPYGVRVGDGRISVDKYNAVRKSTPLSEVLGGGE